MADRIIIGKHPDTATPGMWISKPGYDARIDSNTDHFLFDPSKYNSRPFARLTVGSFTRGAFLFRQTASDGSYWDLYQWDFIFNHSLGFVPQYTCQVDSLLRFVYADTAALRSRLATGKPNDGEYSHYYNANGTFNSYQNNGSWYYDVATDRMFLTKANPSNISVFRNPLF
ncbi:MAG: hypothetical protein JWM36_4328 [Hyphomicrobiales bacterium]|nr:hypothetical protein [Hyphomicrobiales bacterium]